MNTYEGNTHDREGSRIHFMDNLRTLLILLVVVLRA